MSYISDFLKELEKLNKTTVSKVQNTQKKGQIAAGMHSKDQFTSDFFKELHKLEEEEALKKNQEKKKTRFDDPIKTRFNAEDELTTASQKRKAKSTGTVGGGGRSFSSGSGSFAEDEEEKKEKLRKEFINNSLLNSPLNSGAMSLPSIKEKYTADTSGSEEEKNSKTNSSSLYVPIGGGYKINKKSLKLVNNENTVIGEYDPKTGIIKSTDGRTNYIRIKEDGSLRFYDTGLEELGFDTSKANDSWFQAGAFEDGYEFGDLSKSIVATGRELGKGIVSGAMNLGEALVDTGAYLGGLAGKGVGWLSGADDVRMQAWDNMIGDFIAKDIVNEDAIADVIVPDIIGKFTEYESDEAALVGKKGTGLAESAGQLLVQAGLSYVGVPWWLTSGVTSFGGEAENAFKQDATYGEAGFSAGVSALGEVATEKIFGAFKFQGKGLDDGLKTMISRNIQNKTLRTIANLSLDSLGEGGEEWLSGKISAAGQKLSYATDKEIRELFTKEDAWDAFIGGAILGGGSNVTNIVKSKINGVDSVTGLKPNDQKLVDRIYKDEVAKAEKEGKLSKGLKGEAEKNQIYEDIRQALAEGDIDVDVIEQEFGGESYDTFKTNKDAFENSDDFKAYKDVIAEEEALKKEYDELSKVKATEADLGQQARFQALQKRLEELKTKSAELEAKLKPESKRINGLKMKMRGEVMEKVRDDQLAETYRELIRSEQKFTADASQYKSEAAKKTVENFTKNANATNKHRRLFDMAIKIAEDKGIEFDLTDNDKLKGTMHDKGEGVSTNGFITKDGKGGVKVTVNMSSPKALEFIVGHEVTHPFEGTKLYKTLQKVAFKAAESNTDLQKRIQDTRELYKQHDPDADVDGEITGDIIGELVFTDRDFVMNLSTEHRNIFEKMYDEVKYLAKIATAGSTEARRIEKLKKVFAEAYRSTSVTNSTEAKTQHSYSKPNFTKDEWSIVNRRKFQEFDNPKFDLDTGRKWMYAKEKGYTVFAVYSTSDPDDPTILHWSRGEIAEQDYKAVEQYLEGKRNHADRDWTTFDRRLGTVERRNGSRSDGLPVAKGRGTAIGDVSLPFAEQGSYRGRDFGDGTQDSRNTELTEYDKEASEEYSGASSVTWSNDYAAIRNFMKDGESKPQYSLSTDSKGNNLSKEQQEFFKDTVVRDDNGNLKVMYHGSPNGNITQFKAGTYFTENKEYADRYQNTGASSISTGKTASNPKTYAAYLNIKKPFDIATDAEARRIYIEDYIKGGNAIGIDPYLSDAEYSKIEKIDWTEGEDLRDFLIENGYDYDGLVLDEGADGGYGDEVKHRGRSYVIFNPDQAVMADENSDSGVQYSLSEKTTSDDFDRIYDLQVDVNKLTESIREIEKGEEFKAVERKLYEAIDAGNIDGGIKAYQKWLKDSGYEAIKNRRDSLQTELESLRKARDERLAQEALSAEKDAILKSGLSEAEYFRKQAVKEFGYTPYFYDAGYITNNGKLLNFSGEKGRHFGSRGQDHRAIGTIYETTSGSAAMIRFMNDGNIRLMAETPGLDISSSVEPTKEQYATIRKFAREAGGNGYFAVDISDANGNNIGTYEYNGKVNADRVVNDIKYFYQTGNMREASRITDFLSISKKDEIPTGRRYGKNRLTYGSDIRVRNPAENGYDPFGFATKNDIAPTAETVTQEATQETTTQENLFPDDLAPAQNELATLQRQVEQYEDRMIEAVNAGDYSKFNRLNAEYEPIRQRYDQLKAEDDAEFNERMSSITDEDAPPDIAPDYVQTADNIPITKKLVDDIAREVRSSLALSNKDMADVRSIISEFSAQETPSRDDLFHELRDRFGTYSETQTDDTLAEAKSVLRSFKISVDDFIKSEIADYGDLVKRNFGKVRFSKEGTSVDSAYEELASQYPHLFPEDIISPTDQLIQIIDVANMDTSLVSEQRIDDESILGVADTIIDRLSAYKNTQREKTANKLGREAFDSLLEDDSAVPPVDLDGILRNKTLAEQRNDTSGDIAPTSEIYDTQHKKGVVEGQQAMWNDPVPEKVTRKALHERIIDNMKNTFHVNGFELDDVLKNAKNLSTFATVDNTPQRVMEKALGYKAGGVLADMTVNKVAQNETEGIKWLNSFTDRKNGLLAKISKQYHIKPGSKQSAAAQMYAEGFYVGENNEIIRYGDAELAQDFPDKQVQKNIKGLARDPRIRQIYDDTLVMINEARKRNAYPEIPRLDNYFLHFRAMDDTFSRLGLPFNPNDIRAKDLPTDLNGVTADLKPGQPYFASAMHREGKRTSFDLLGGLEKYLNSAKNQIYHIDDIQNLRALRNYIADTYGQANGLDGLDALSEEEQQDRIEQVYGSHLSTFAKFLNEEANVLAGKTALIDRGLEGIIGRRGITFLNSLNRQVGSNLIGGNISSALTNFDSVARAFAKTNKFSFIKGFAQFSANKVGSIFGKNDGFADNSPVIIRRKGAESFYRTPWQKLSDPGYILMSAVDNVSTELITRAKYNEFVKKGMDSQKAHIETDKWVSRLMGDRSLGQQPQLYNSKMLGLITKFQLEVRNNLDSNFYDTIQEAKVSNEEIQNKLARNAKTAAKVTSTFVQLAVAQHLFGKAFESVAGYNPAFDIIDVIIKTFGWDDEEEDEDTVLDNVEEGFLALLEDLPYTSTFTGGRIPISSALPINQLVTGKDDYGNEKPRWETALEALPYYLMPGGYGQAKKTAKGLSMFSDEHPTAGSYTDSGGLRFPVEDTLGNRIKAGVFGQWAFPEARDYIDNERKPLDEKQTQEYIDADMPYADYRNYRDGLSKVNASIRGGKLGRQADYINSLDLPVRTKNLLINNLTDRKDPIDLTDYSNYADFEEFDFAQKNPEKYAFFKEIGVSVKDYNKANEETKRVYTWAYDNPEKYNFIKEQGVSLTDWKHMTDSSKDAYMWAYENPEKHTVAKAVASDVVEYRKYTGDLYDIKADKDKNGKSISGSRKTKVAEYISGLDIDDGAKYILFKSEYPSDDTYNYEIIDYLNRRDDISFDEMNTILTELGFKVTKAGKITWD